MVEPGWDNLQEQEEEKTSKKESPLRSLLSWVFTLVAALVASLILTQFVIVNASIPSESMEDTIMVGDRVIGFRLSYVKKDPQRLDIVIFRYPDDERQLFVKRVIGLPGDVVTIKEGRVYLNDNTEPLADSYVKGVPTGDYGPYEVPEGCYFMMGDNRNSSWDSRFWDNTYVQRDKVVGKAVFRLFPHPGPIH